MTEDTKAAFGIVGFFGVIAAIVLFMIFAPFTIISAGERGIVLHWGNVDRVLTEGIHWRTPIIESVVKMSISTLKEEASASAASKDMQTVQTKVAVNYNLRTDKLREIYNEVQENVVDVVIEPAIQEAVKAATAKYTAEELITKREWVKADIQASLSERLAKNYVTVSNIAITDFDFSPDFNIAIENKVKAEQNALTAKNILEQKKYEAEALIVNAKAEAESIRMQSEAANNEKYVSLKAIEVQLELAKRWKGDVPTNMYGSSPIPFLNLGTNISK